MPLLGSTVGVGLLPKHVPGVAERWLRRGAGSPRSRRTMTLWVREDAKNKYSTIKVGTHDDLVTPLGLALLDDPIGEAEAKHLIIW